MAIVTGAARGLGLATSKLLGSEGATVVMVDVNGKLLEQSGALLSEHGLAAEIATRDTTDKDAVADLVDRTIDRYGRIDVLVNLAATRLHKTIEKTTLDDWQQVIQSTLDSSFLTARAVLPHMRRARYGRIVNTSSETVFLAGEKSAMDVTAKMGVIGLTRVLAREAGEDGITANVIMPGFIETEYTRELCEERVRQGEALTDWTQRQCVPRAGEPRDIAHAVAYIASREAGFLTGQTIRVDGGLNFI